MVIAKDPIPKETADKVIESLQKPTAAYLFAIGFMVIVAFSTYYEGKMRTDLIRAHMGKIEENRSDELRECHVTIREITEQCTQDLQKAFDRRK